MTKAEAIAAHLAKENAEIAERTKIRNDQYNHMLASTRRRNAAWLAAHPMGDPQRNRFDNTEPGAPTHEKAITEKDLSAEKVESIAKEAGVKETVIDAKV